MDLRAIAEKLSVDDIVDLLARNLKSEEQLKTLTQQVEQTGQQVEQLQRQLNWFRRQVFGARSERRILDVLPRHEQMWLGEQMLDVPEEPPKPGTTVRSYERSQRRNPVTFSESDSRLKFDESKVTVETIYVPNPEIDAIEPNLLQDVSERVTYRLAQRQAYVVLKYVQRVVKRLDTNKLVSTPAPPVIFDRSFADVSFLAGMIVDKFQHHLPLYRQHQRLQQAGVTVNRGTLTRLVHRSAELLEPVYDALFSSVLQSRVLTVDESPTPAGLARGRPGKIKTGYFWALFGDYNEIAYLFSPTRSRQVIDVALESFEGTLLTDGYGAYESYVSKTRQGKVNHAQCWVHTRRNFTEAESFMPEKTAEVLLAIQRLYRIEEQAAGPDLKQRMVARQELSKPIVDKLFDFFRAELDSALLLPSNPYLKAIQYALAREKQLRVFLRNPEVPMDTNHVERELRGPAIGRKNWMFHVTEVGARYAAIFYSLIHSCNLAGVDPTEYLIDILQRVGRHEATEIHLLLPQQWRDNFADQPLASDVSKRP